MGFVDVPASGDYWLSNSRIPAALLGEPVPGIEVDGDGLALADIEVAGAVIARIGPAGTAPARSQAVQVDGGQVWPCFVDLHTHLASAREAPAENDDRLAVHSRVRRDLFPVTFGAGDASMLDGQ